MSIATIFFRRTRAAWLSVLLLVSALLSPIAAGQESSSPMPPSRTYADGPLTWLEYQSEPPADARGLDAMTNTDIRYEYRYETREQGRRVTVYLTEWTIETVLLRDGSWTKRPNDPRLLDHEQGHFDLTEIATRRAQLHFTRLPKVGQRLVAVGGDSETAVKILEGKFNEQLQPFLDQALAEHKAYDQRTRHGLSRERQREERQQQREKLRALAAELQQATE